jgi:hypothetical protein
VLSVGGDRSPAQPAPGGSRRDNIPASVIVVRLREESRLPLVLAGRRDGVAFAGRALLRDADLADAERIRGIDQRNMRESLREIAELAAAARMVFLRQQTEIVGVAEEALEQRADIGVPAA